MVFLVFKFQGLSISNLIDYPRSCEMELKVKVFNFTALLGSAV